MPLSITDAPRDAVAQPMRLTVADYMKLGELGIIPEDQRTELIDGVIVYMTPPGPDHAFSVGALLNLLSHRLGERAILQAQNPLFLGEHNQPEPDVMLLKPPMDRYRGRLPQAEDVLLLIEVSESSVRFDEGVKEPLYALAGIPEYWRIELPHRRLVALREPQGGRYTQRSIHQLTESLAPSAFPEDAIDLTQVA